MISGSMYKYNQGIAAFLFFVLFSQLTWPVLASQKPNNIYYYTSLFRKSSIVNDHDLLNANSVPANNLNAGFNLPLEALSTVKANIEKTRKEKAKLNEAIKNLGIEQSEESGPGPGQPEMQSFQPVNNNNMVDLFTGDFSYNIPLLDVGGYPVNLHYQSGITMDQEASWVGLGWNINPGTISRSIRGLPDDFNGSDNVIKTTSIKPNKTLGLTVSGNTEIFGKELPVKGSDTGRLSVSIGASLGIFHNTYKGWGTEIGINAGINAGLPAAGSLSSGLGLTNNSQDGLDISPSFGVAITKLEKLGIGEANIGTNYNSRTGIQGLQMTMQIGLTNYYKDNNQKVKEFIGGGIPSFISFAKPSYTPTISIPFTSSQFAFTAKLGGEKWVIHHNTSFKGYTSVQYIAPEDTTQVLPAYGYLYYQNAGTDQHVLLDFNRDKDVPYRENVPHIAVPSYTYDTYSISGEGTGGMFRPYRGDIGFVFDHSMATKSNSSKFSLDLGFGQRFHVGIDFNGTYTSTKSNSWTDENVLKDQIRFKNRDTTFEEVYFKNPGEKTSVNQVFYDGIGDVDLVKAQLTKFSPPGTVLSSYFDRYKNARIVGQSTIGSNSFRQNRDKRNQVISFLTAKDASNVGLDTDIKSYPVNVFPNTSCNVAVSLLPRVDILRKEKHISEITVLNDDGRRYVYGTPVYNITQQDVTFASKQGSSATGLVDYLPGDNSTKNKNGIDNYFSREVLPPYAHSYLLTGILSGDYVDVKGDGITEDDIGDAIKFNYSKVYGSSNAYKWRAPYFANKASYNEGLKTDTRDEKGSYSYGTKEIWYLNSLESKTMMATFVLETDVDSLRKDVYGVKDDNGGQDATQKLYRLKEINLYAKADLIRYGIAKAKAIKTVHFDYEYSLCSNNPSAASGYGKLTLKKVWFSYNKNVKGRLNPYEFTYHINNPSYNNNSYDRWGNYKDPSSNPGGLSNMDYPYTAQYKGTSLATDSTNAATAVAAWTLTNIKLPSGGKLKVSYESDEYAFVQNKRAMQMFTINGFGKTSTSTSQPYLYDAVSKVDNYYIFINVTDPIAATNTIDIKKEIQSKYLEGIKKLYFKLFVKMPADKWGSGSETIPCYADIEDYGLKGNNSDKTIWIKVAAINGSSPISLSAMQFLRLNLPSKAYPQSEPGDDVSLRQIVGTLKSAVANISQTKKGFTAYSKDKGWCRDADVQKSFIKLDNPLYRKFGGGLRVKKIEISDNWNAMTGQAESKYGQEYDYTTIKEINGAKTRISSGVASYEPSIGKDENPFTVAIDYYKENIGALAPTNYFYTEEPLAESYFPSAFVGYSKVRVQTIHKDKKSANGVEETEFYTTYDFPTKTEFTTLADGKVTYDPKLANFFKFNAKHYVTLSQGFKVELNDMNGKMKKQASYSQKDLENPYSYTVNYYKVQNDNLQNSLSGTVPIIDSSNGIIRQNGEIGKDIDILVDLREQTTKTLAPGIQANLDIAKIFPPLIFPSAIPSSSFETNRYRSVAVMKVVNRYGILDSVIHVENGSKISTKNMVYDGETGNVLLTRTNNEFDDPVYNFNYPAHWAYSGMGHAYKNLNAVLKNMIFKEGRLFKSEQPFASEKFFESGDELLVTTNTKIVSTQYISGSCEPTYTSSSVPETAFKVWAIEASKGKEGNKGIFFIDRLGKPFSALQCTVSIIRSGKRNFTGTTIGSITMLDNPIKTISNVDRIAIDSLSKVITASAGEFKDLWRVDSSLYAKDSCYSFVKSDSITLTSTSSMLFRKVTKRRKSQETIYQDDNSYLNQNLTVGILRKDRVNNSPDQTSFQLTNTSIVDFDFSRLNGITVTSAKISFGAKPYNDTVHQFTYHPLFGSSRTYLGEIRNSKAHYLNGADQSYGNSFNMERVVSPWTNNSNIKMGDIAVSHTNSVLVGGAADASCTDLNSQECGPLIQDIINSSNRNGIMLTVPGIVAGGGQADASRSRSFYSGFNYNPSNEDACKLGLDHYFNYIPPIKPTLKIYYSTSKDTCVKLCRPNIDSTSINPYVWGILGNWRMNKSYTYYSKRKESDPTSATNIRTDEQIQGFMPYWAFNSNYVNASSDTTRWVWNSEILQFNRKGMEIENKDPLQRFNSGQYGYNQNLPVAVVQNSKLRNSMFDGFEDYDYKTNACNALCSTARFIDLVTGSGIRDSIYKHSGLYSIKIPGNQTSNSLIPVYTAKQDSTLPTVSIKIDTIINSSKVVNGKGNGLLAKYGIYFALALSGINKCVGHMVTSVEWASQTEVSNVDKVWGTGHPSQICGSDFFMGEWNGFIQPRYTDFYTFRTSAADGVKVILNNATIIDALTKSNQVSENQSPIYLEQGKLYPIKVSYVKKRSYAQVHLSWYSIKQSLEIIPASQLYIPSYSISDTAGSVTTISQNCIKPNNPKPVNITTKTFSPIAGTKMIVGAWVKEDQPCINGAYTNSSIDISFTGSAATFQLRPTGKVIEGWQRIEDTLTIPLIATSMQFKLRSLSSTTVYFDDIRMHPFNALMKSFVYNPVNLRLMGELDENNYATFYEYDDDGSLVRLKKETERGIKTIKETRSALYKDQ